MAPGSGKRKRSDRQFSHDDGANRPSPHRPDRMALAQQSENSGGRRGGRGGYRGQTRSGNDSFGNGRNAASPSQQPPTERPEVTPGPEISRTNTPLPVKTTAPAVQPPARTEPKLPPAPYSYDYLTDEVMLYWQKSGKQKILDTARSADEMTASILVQELIRASIDEKLDAAEAGSVVREMIADHAGTGDIDVQYLFLNTISLLDESEIKDPALWTLVVATDIDPVVIRSELDVPLLQALSVVRGSFAQMRTRKTTNLLYRQANFNLLREESEGYAKLMTEYFNIAQEVSANRDGKPQMAEDAFQRIKALVGAFDLDIGRVLDITLDISANSLVKAFGFFIKFYRCSSWWPDHEVFDNVKWEDQGFDTFPSWALPGSGRDASNEDERDELASLRQARDVRFWERVQEIGMDAYFELGMRKIVDYESVADVLNQEVEPQLDGRGKEAHEDKRKRINENRKFMRETRMLPPPGNPDAAQLLGFKLRYYASQVRSAQDMLPENLVALAALLIKIGFISLRDLYPHLSPPDEDMAAERNRLEKQKAEKLAKERPGAGLNSLAMSGALPDDDPPPVARNLRTDKDRSGGATPKPAAKDDEPKEELPRPDNQKIMLLRALLLIGALPEALYILGRFPWLADADVSIPPHLLRIVKHMLSKIADGVRPARDREDLAKPKDQLADTVSGANGTMLFTPRVPRKSVRWLGLDAVDPDTGGEFRFYYTDWANNVPVCQSVDDVFLLCNTFINYLGFKIGREPAILGTLVRLAKQSLTEDFSEINRTRWLELMRRLLVPSLSLSKHNPGITQEIYDLLMLFPMATRYNIYAEWFYGKVSRMGDMLSAHNYNRLEVKDVLRRVTNETGKKQARALAKVSYSSPGVVMEHMIKQLETYSNMIPALVECTRYFSALAYDVLTWSIIKSLTGDGASRRQADGMLTSPWLQALAQFIASLFQRYSALDPAPVLQYLAYEIRSGNSTDLEVFEQIFAEMAGIKPDMQFSDSQVQAMAGGDALQSVIIQRLADLRHARKTSAKRLIKALTEPGLVGQLLIAIAQEEYMYPNRDVARFQPLKVLTNNLDKIHQVSAQYLDVLKSNMKPDEFEASVPGVIALIGDYGLQAASAFTICRAAISHRIAEFDEAKKQEDVERKKKASEEKQSSSTDVEMQDTENKTTANVCTPDLKTLAGGDSQDARVNENEETRTATANMPSTTNAQKTKSVWHPVLEPIIERLPAVTGDLCTRISIPFFVTFWTLAQSDVVVFTESYTQEIDKISRQISSMTAERGESTLAARERERKKRALQETSESLRVEVTSRVAVYSRITSRLSREKHSWFPKPADREELGASHIALLQECFLPRAMLSSLDAHFSFLMFKLLHDKGTPGFNTVHFLTHLFHKHTLAAVMFQCTAQEAQHFGRFLNEILKLLARWHAEKATYEKEAIGTKTKLPGFQQPFAAEGTPDAYLDYEVFRRLLTNWHSALNAAILACFESGEYSHIRSSIFVLKAVHQVFPALNFQGKSILQQVTRLAKEEQRQDLKVMAMSLIGPLTGREKKWVMPQAFRLNDPSKDGKPAGRATSTLPETPHQGTETPKLNATAPEFKPNTPNGLERKESGLGIEDGEVEEEKQMAAKAEDTEMQDNPAGGDLTIKPASEDTASAQKAQDKSKDEDGLQANPASNSANGKMQTPDTRPPGRGQTPRGPHPLPARQEPVRPETRGPLKSLPLPPQAMPGRRSNRPDEQYGRLDRPNTREHSPGHRSRATTPPGSSRHGPPRGGRDEPRPRDDQRMPSRHDHHGTHPRASVVSSGSGRTTTDSSSGPTPHPDRAGLLSSANAGDESGYHENPARLAQINGNRGERDSRDQRGPPEGRLNDRARAAEPSREGPRDLTPKGPRNGRGRDMPPPSTTESSYGRLNGSTETAPAGPRLSGNMLGSRGRDFTSNQPGGTPRNHEAAGAAANSPLESSASFRRHGQRQSMDAQQSNSVPATPSSEGASIGGMHPSRAAAFGIQPSPIQTNVHPSTGPRNTDSPGSGTPSGPRNAGRTPASVPTGPSPITPIGPASDRPKREDRGRRNINAINATLQGNNGAPPGSINFRGASSRQGSTSMSSAVAVAPEQATPSANEVAPRRHERPPSRQDNRPTGSDLFQRPVDGGQLNAGRQRHNEDDGQHGSRNASRDGRDRAPPSGPHDDGRERRGGHRGDERRSRDERDSHGSERRTTERGHRGDEMQQRRHGQLGGYPGSRAEWEHGREREHPSEELRRGGPDNRGGRRGPPHGPPPPPPPPPPGGPPPRRDEGADRKRRHDDGGFDPTKRRRSGK
ncbi:transcription factor/nuclear export subunit protein 2-domain-containing protein [Acrodontium crateriforme]|uniref:THO complex subunit 2 n=1 Tax=Acrodontium crateriforme TaxID=150365 RepID=A0AAQ3LXE3_9PEZI|nr:transcription factor/nuclear export subunit protein 2-domain-containing protein [Acrodontium crateriforme]